MKTSRFINGNIKVLFFLSAVYIISCKSQEPSRLNVVVGLNIGESKEVELINGETVKLTLHDMNIIRDSLRKGVRAAYVKITVDGEEVILGMGNYNLPVTVGKVKINENGFPAIGHLQVTVTD